MNEQFELEKAIAEFKESIKDKTYEELIELEKGIVEEASAKDKEASEKTFEIKVSSTERSTFGKTIAEFLAKSSVNWNQALALNYIISFWKGKEMSIAYPVLDTTLRTLGQVNYSGAKDFEQVAKVNEFFETLREEFMAFTNNLYDVAQRHEVLLKQMELVKPGSTEE